MNIQRKWPLFSLPILALLVFAAYAWPQSGIQDNRCCVGANTHLGCCDAAYHVDGCVYCGPDKTGKYYYVTAVTGPVSVDSCQPVGPGGLCAMPGDPNYQICMADAWFYKTSDDCYSGTNGMESAAGVDWICGDNCSQ